MYNNLTLSVHLFVVKLGLTITANIHYIIPNLYVKDQEHNTYCKGLKNTLITSY